VSRHPLGRLVQHDPRSLAYPAPVGVWDSVQHDSHAPILDQGNLGSCTGNAMAGALSYDPLWPAVARPIDETFAVELYARATQLDAWPGSYPPDDTGSSGLAVSQAAREAGYLSGYQHAFTIDAALTALMDGPVITGIDWHDGMFDPDQSGQVHPTGQVAGGHEICADGIDKHNGLVWFRNSWGPGWGVDGRFSLAVADWSQLLSAKGDATTLVPADAPAPQPDYDQLLIAAMDPWEKGIISKLTKAGKAAAAYRLWKLHKGL
jgi:hypothetical protein